MGPEFHRTLLWNFQTILCATESGFCDHLTVLLHLARQTVDVVRVKHAY